VNLLRGSLHRFAADVMPAGEQGKSRKETINALAVSTWRARPPACREPGVLPSSGSCPAGM
jgi:hypothetical protein